MKPLQFLSAIFFVTLISCQNNRTRDTGHQEPPKALEDRSISSEFLSKRGDDDLVESLYQEVVTNDAGLQKLESNIEDLSKSNADSTASFDKFDTRNKAYFNSVDQHVSVIRDSMLRAKMKTLVAGYLERYNSSIEQRKKLKEIIEANDLTIGDLHNIFKIIRTLPLIEKYQRDNLPNQKSLKGLIQRQEETIKLADTLSK